MIWELKKLLNWLLENTIGKPSNKTENFTLGLATSILFQKLYVMGFTDIFNFYEYSHISRKIYL